MQINFVNTAKLNCIQITFMSLIFGQIRYSVTKLFLVVLMPGVVFAAQPPTQPVRPVPVRPGSRPMRPGPVRSQTGTAVYYSDRMDGRTVSLKGEKYDKNGMTAATHSNFPLGSRIRVTNLRNRKSVELRVTDRMNPRSRSVVDVSRRAAEQLGMIHSGHAQVRVEMISRS